MHNRYLDFSVKNFFIEEVIRKPMRAVFLCLASVIFSFIGSQFSGSLYHSSIFVKIGSYLEKDVESTGELEAFLKATYPAEKDVEILYIKNLGRPNHIKIKLRSSTPGLSIKLANEIGDLIKSRHYKISQTLLKDLYDLDASYVTQKMMFKELYNRIQKEDYWKQKSNSSADLLYFISVYNLGEIQAKAYEVKKKIMIYQKGLVPGITIEQEVQNRRLPFISMFVGAFLIFSILFIFYRFVNYAHRQS